MRTCTFGRVCSRWLLSSAELPPKAAQLTSSGVSALLLTKRDVGAAYSLNRGITHRRTLAERSEGDGNSASSRLAAKWVAGAQTGFDGSAVSNQAILAPPTCFGRQALRRSGRPGRRSTSSWARARG